MVIITRAGETNQVHYTGSPLAALQQWTFGFEPVSDAKVCPDSSENMVLFTQDSGGNEQYQIYCLNPNVSKPIMLTDGKSQNGGMVWSNRGDRFVFQSNCRNHRDFDLYMSSKDPQQHPRNILDRGGDWSIMDWSPDDSLILVSKYSSRTASEVYILNPVSGSLQPLHDTTDTASMETAAWGADNSGIFYTSDQNTDFRTLRHYDRTTKKDTILTSAISWDVRELALSRDRNLLAFTVNEHGYSRVYTMDTRTFAYHEIMGLPCGVIYRLRFNNTSDQLAFTVNGPQSPEDIYAVSLRDFTVQQWTKSAMGQLSKSDMIAPELISYPTFDSIGGKPRAIPCFYYIPRKGKPPFSTLIFVHGGPESQYWPYFSPAIQFFINELGLAVLAPNIRGSGGYGRKYLTLDNGFKREDAIKDIGALLDWIGQNPVLDSQRIAVMGGSYGGYVTLASMERYDRRLKAGIDLYGISNFITFLAHTAAYRKDLRRVEYGDERDSAMNAFLHKISPVSRAQRIKGPLLIIQGNNDPRVPVEESRQIAQAIQHNKAQAWLLIAMNEGHGFEKKSNKDYQELVEAFFLKKFLFLP